jgi:hypothetical protein
MALLVLASSLYRLMANRMRGYDDAQARRNFRDLIDMSADVAITEREVTARFHRRAHLPIVLAFDLINKSAAVPVAERTAASIRTKICRRLARR